MPLLQQNIPRPDGADPLVLSLSAGDVVYLVGPNGSGKSALIARLSQEIPQGRFRRIAAHRQNWMPADASSYNPAQILEQREALKHLAQRPDARFMERFPADVPINLLLAALKAAENEWHREFARENRETAFQFRSTRNRSHHPSPF
jgi:ATPase subunit of ABC transporter with duplicated ATPase domains